MSLKQKKFSPSYEGARRVSKNTSQKEVLFVSSSTFSVKEGVVECKMHACLKAKWVMGGASSFC